MGQAIGCGAMMTRLRRLQSGQFKIADSIPLEELKTLSREEFKEKVIPFYTLQKMAVTAY